MQIRFWSCWKVFQTVKWLKEGLIIYIRFADAMAAVDWPKNNSKELIAEFKKHENFKGNITRGNGKHAVT